MQNLITKFVFLIFVFTVRCSQATDNSIVVDNEIGFDSSSCLDGKIHCQTLDFVFLSLSDCKNILMNISILNGIYNFTLNSTVTNDLFQNCPAISITGLGTDNTSIVCGPDAGLAFHSIAHVKIANINFTNCGSLRNSTSINLNSSAPQNRTLLLSAALYFTYCRDVQILNVIVQNSNSTGVVMYNTYGNLTVEGSSFQDNGNEQKYGPPSNGGFYTEFVYCDPGKIDENCIQQNNYNASYSFISSRFSFNYASDSDTGALFYLPYKANYYSFGRGGGLSIVFKGNASNNSVAIDDCLFYNNSASWGGGLLVEFEDFSKNNTVIINNTNFSLNSVFIDSENGYGTAGGGVRVGYVIFEPESVQFNAMSFENCIFDNNRALWGGGFGLYLPAEPNVINATNSLVFKNCSWISNQGLLGSAVDLDYWRINTRGDKMQVDFLSCKFHGNINGKYKTLLSNAWREFNSFGTGALYANGIPIMFQDSVEFVDNSGSALAMYDTTASFSENCNTLFMNNDALMGGAIALLGAAQIWINPNTFFRFENNRADLRGGAIYALQTSRHDLLSGGNCFLQHVNQSISPDNWDTKFTFKNNDAPTGSSIFATTLLSCAWGASFGDLNFSLKNVLHWTNFLYSPFDNNTIATDVSKISLQKNSVDVIPGKYSKLPICSVDDKGHDVSRSLWLISNNSNVQVSWHLTGSSTIDLQGMPGDKATIRIVTDSSRVVSASLPIMIVQCPPGYYLNNGTCLCSYLNNKQRLDGILSCDRERFAARIKRGYWAGYHLYSGELTPSHHNLVTGQCSRYYCRGHMNSSKQDIFLPGKSDISALNSYFCSASNRNGTLCGRCSNGHSVAINSINFRCITCSYWLSRHGWLIYVLTEYVPSTLLFCFVLFFDINLHSGAISSVVLYFQIFILLNIYSDRDVEPPSNSQHVLEGIEFMYNIWNLEFFGSFLPPYCLNKHFNTMDILLVKYISGFYPFLLLLLFAASANLVYVNFCGWERITICLRTVRNGLTRLKFMVARKGSTVSGLATFSSLVFTKLALISGLILSREILTGSENSTLVVKVAWLDGSLPLYGEKHLPYMIPAVFVLTFCVIIPALSLLCYPLVPQILGMIQERSNINFNQYKWYNSISRLIERPFIYLKPLIDCFQGSCKARCEFYAGLLCCYRIAMVCLFSFTIRADIFFYSAAVSLLFVIITAVVQPYKKRRDNIITILCISNIVLINLVSIYHLYYSDTQSGVNLEPLLWFQLVLVLLPLVFFVIFMCWRSFRKFKAFWNQEPIYSPVSQDDKDELDDFPARALGDSMRSDDEQNTNNELRLESASRGYHKGASQSGSKGAYSSGSGGCAGNLSDNQ